VTIFACVILITQVIPIAEGADSSAREQAKAESNKIKVAFDAFKQKIRTAKDTWNAAKDTADTAKDTFRADKTVAKKAAWKQAQAKETTAYKAWKQAIKDFKNFKSLSKTKTFEKASRDDTPTKKKTVSEARQKAEADRKKIEALWDQFKQKVRTAQDAWSAAKDTADTAKDTFRADKTVAKKAAWKQAQAKETTAYKAWKQSIEDYKNFKIKNLLKNS